MQCMILKSFPFARDGVTAEQAVAGREADIPAELVPGLTREGYVRTVSAAGIATAVEPALEVPAVEPMEVVVEPPFEAPRPVLTETKRRRGRPARGAK